MSFSDNNGLYRRHGNDSNIQGGSGKEGLSLVTKEEEGEGVVEEGEGEFFTPPKLFTPTFESISQVNNNNDNNNNNAINSSMDTKVANLPSPLVTIGKRGNVPLRPSMNNESNNAIIPMINIKKVRNGGDNNNNNNNNNNFSIRMQSEFTPSDIMMNFTGSNAIKPTSRIVTLPSGYQPPMIKDDDKIPSIIKEESEEEEEEEEEEDRRRRRGAEERGKFYKTYDINTGVETLWECTKEIGSGTFSKVYITKDNKTAIKVSKLPKDGDNNNNNNIISSLLRELEILKEISKDKDNKHPNIVQLLGYNDESYLNSKVIMVMPYYKGGDLFSFILNYSNKITNKLISIIMANIVSGVNFLHFNNIVHRDLKLENILLIYDIETIFQKIDKIGDDDNLNEPIAVIIDFGLSKKIDPLNPMLITRCGSDDYVSPELLLGQEYDGKQNDIWSLGVLLYTILESRLPFDPLPILPNLPIPKLNKYKPSHRIASISWDWFYLKNSNFDENGNDWSEAKKLVEKCLVKRTKRCDITYLYNSNWLNKYVN